MKMKTKRSLSVLLALCVGTAFAEIKSLTPGSSLNLADHDVGKLRDFVKGGGVLFCSDALYRTTWQLLGQIDEDFGNVTWRNCESWAKDGDSQTLPLETVKEILLGEAF